MRGARILIPAACEPFPVLRYRTKDDRGNDCRVHALWLGELPTRGAVDARPFVAWIRWARHAIRELAAIGFSRPVLIGAVVGGGILALIVLTLRVGPFALAVTLFSPVSSTLILVMLTAGVAIVGGASRVLARSRRRIIDRARCPSCLYSLREIEPDDDDATTCPECGNAWDLRPIGATQVVVVRSGTPGLAHGGASVPQSHHQRREIKRPPTIVASTGLPPSS